MCGIIAALLADTTSNAIFELYEGLCMLQHRGQVRGRNNVSKCTHRILGRRWHRNQWIQGPFIPMQR
jgi:glutamine phosphoribosylpyrophosphate amidotransferase